MADFLERLFGSTSTSRNDAATREQRRRSLRRVMQLETLQKREVFATLVDAMTLTFQDKDGDQVQALFSKPILTQSNVNSVFKFDSQNVNGSNFAKQQLKQIQLAGIEGATDVEMKLSVTQRGVAGDGYVHVGEVMAKNVDLRVVDIAGDLGRIAVGDANVSTRALQVLKTQSLGAKGTSTGAGNLVTNIQGGVGSIQVLGDIRGAQLSVGGSVAQINVDGSLQGSFWAKSGEIDVRGSVGGVYVNGEILGGNGENSGRIEVIGKVDYVEVLGSIRGGNGAGSGAVAAATGFGDVWLKGNLAGGNGKHSGSIATLGDIHKLGISGSIVGAGMRSGEVSAWGSIDSLRVDGPILGGSGAESGLIEVQHTLAEANLGSLGGGGGNNSGRIKAHDLGQIRLIKIKGGNGNGSGTLEATNSIAFLEVGNIIGGSGTESGSVKTASGDIQGLLIAGNLQGGSGIDSGSVRSGRSIVNAHVDNHILGGVGNGTGRIHAEKDILQLEVTGDVVGSKGVSSGKISSGGKMVDVRINGSLIGGTNDFSGHVSAAKEIVLLKIGKDLKGGDLFDGLFDGPRTGPHTENGNGLSQAGYVQAKSIINLEVGGSIRAGINTTKQPFGNNGAVRALDNVGSLVVHGDLVGSGSNPVIIAARGMSSNNLFKDLAISSIRVDGNTSFAKILAGVDGSNRMINADASIGTISVGHDWSETDVLAGVVAGIDNQFGTFDDRKAFGPGVVDSGARFSTIDEIIIAGEITGPRAAFDPHFGIVAEEIRSVKIGGIVVPMANGIGNDHVDAGFGLAFHEIGAKKGRTFAG